MWIATLPAPHSLQMAAVAQASCIDGARLNTGASTPYKPKEAIKRTLAAMKGKPLWIDLKGRQLRITQWAVPTFGDIVLNHKIQVDLPAKIIFRGDDASSIVEFDGNRIFVDPPPKSAVGMGQAVNIIGRNLAIDGYLIDNDIGYIKESVGLGVHDYMLSFTEKESDIREVERYDPVARTYAKIESRPGLQFVRDVYPKLGERVRLVLAADDLYINLEGDEMAMFDAIDLIIKADPQAIAASRLLTSLQTNDTVSLQDLAYIRFLEALGYKNFMLSDGMCTRQEIFARTSWKLTEYRSKFDGKTPERINLFTEAKNERDRFAWLKFWR